MTNDILRDISPLWVVISLHGEARSRMLLHVQAQRLNLGVWHLEYVKHCD